MLQSEFGNCETDVNSVFGSSKTALGVKNNDMSCHDTDISLSEIETS